jgi:hypothetical protein
LPSFVRTQAPTGANRLQALRKQPDRQTGCRSPVPRFISSRLASAFHQHPVASAAHLQCLHDRLSRAIVVNIALAILPFVIPGHGSIHPSHLGRWALLSHTCQPMASSQCGRHILFPNCTFSQNNQPRTTSPWSPNPQACSPCSVIIPDDGLGGWTSVQVMVPYNPTIPGLLVNSPDQGNQGERLTRTRSYEQKS